MSANGDSRQTAELRLYTIRSENLDSFIAEWTAKVVPLRATFGFNIGPAWADRSTNTFAYLMSLEEGFSWEESVQAYADSPARLALDPPPSRFVESLQAFPISEVIAVP